MVTSNSQCIAALLIAAFFVLMTAPAQAAFQAFVDRNPVAVDESFTLTLKSDESLDSNPDLSVLQLDFDVLGQTRGSSIQIINGNATQSTHWQISLMAKRSGQLTIPAIMAGKQTTQPIALNVTAVDQAQAAQQSGELFIEVNADPRTAYVQQQMIFTARLYRNVNIGNGSTLSDPKFPGMDAVVERLGEDRSYQTTHNGQAYAVIERRYAVYPQKSGQFISEPVQFDGEVIEARQGGGIFMFDPFNQNSRHKRANSKSVTFSIKPVPAALGGTPWLPTNKLQLAEQWSENPPKFIVGEPITRTLVISANALTASQLPTLGGNTIEGFKLYPDQPTLKNDKDSNGVKSVRTQKIALMPLRAGYYTLPEIEIRWWNIATDKEEVTQLPARNITVLPTSSNQQSAVSAGISSYELPEQQTLLDTPPALNQAITTNTTQGWWLWLALFFAVGWLATSFIWWWQARKKTSPAVPIKIHKDSPRGLEKQLQKNCLSHDATLAKATLLAWAKLCWPQNSPTSLTAMARLCQPDLASALIELDRTLYAKNQGSWQGEHLWGLFSRSKAVAEASQIEKKDTLEQLYLAT